MPAARYWRIASIETYAGGDLELSEVALYDGSTRVDGSATVSSVVAPVSGSLTDLGDASFSTSARWAGDAVRMPGFAVVWDFGAGVTKDVTSVGVAGPGQTTFAHKFVVEYSDNGSDWTVLYTPPVASKWPGATALYVIDAAGSADDWPALIVGHAPDAHGYSISTWTRSGDTFTRSAGVPSSSSNAVYRIATNGGCEFYAAGHNVFSRSGYTVGNGAPFGTDPLVVVRGAAISPDGTYLVTVNSNNSPYINIFKRVNGVFVKQANPATIPTGEAYGCAFDPTGTYLAVAHYTSPFLTIYKRSGDTFTKLANPSTLPTGGALSVAWNASGDYVAVGHSVSPYITVYSRSGDTFTKLANPSTLPTGAGNSLSFDPTGTYLAHGDNGALGLNFFKLVAGTLSHLGTYAVGVGNATGLAFDATGAYLAVSKDGVSGFVVFKRTGDSLSLLSTVQIPGGVYSYSVAFLPYSALAPNMDPANYDATPLRTDDQAAPSMIGEAVIGSTQPVTAALPSPLDIYDGGRGRVTGTVKEKNTPTNTPLKRRVVLLSMPGSRAIRETWSDPVTGVYEFTDVAMDRVYTVVSYDHTGVYRGVVADNLVPEVMP